MFGHQDDQPDHHDDQPVENVLSNEAATAVAQGDFGAPALSDDSAATDDFNPALPPAGTTPSITSHGQDLSLPTPTSTDDTKAEDALTEDASVATETEATMEPAATVKPEATSSRDSDAAAADTPANHDLLDIKLQALNQLSPLVDHLDQTPEEKFRTTMMMIQAADNQALIKNAYEAAQAIPDEKVKAQALLDIVNEINYFTQKNA